MMQGNRTMQRLTLLLWISIGGLAVGSGCSLLSVKLNRSTSESVSISEQTKNSVCTAAIRVQVSASGKMHTLHQAGVPCSNVTSVQRKLISQAKQGL